MFRFIHPPPDKDRCEGQSKYDEDTLQHEVDVIKFPVKLAQHLAPPKETGSDSIIIPNYIYIVKHNKFFIKRLPTSQYTTTDYEPTVALLVLILRSCYDELMNLHELTIPGAVLESAEYVCKYADRVKIIDKYIHALLPVLRERIDRGVGSVEESFGTTGNLEDDVNLVFFETACNFYFWGENEGIKWKVATGDKQIGGWYGLVACFSNAIERGVPVHDAGWMAKLTPAKARELFTDSGSQIPLLEQRVNNIVEMANFLLRRYDGRVTNLVKACDYSAPRIALEVTREQPSFRDGAIYKNRWVWILKRAQILPSDLSQLTSKYPDFVITDCDKLTAFADYQIPRVLRHYGILRYSDDLANAVDSLAILPVGSSEEVEIRAACIVACERIKQLMSGVSSSDVDVGIWLLSQDMRHDPSVRPHHRTPDYFY